MKTNFDALGIFHSSGAIASTGQPVRHGFGLARPLAALSSMAPALLLSLLAHALLLLVCAAGWRMYAAPDARSEVISVFTVQEEQSSGNDGAAAQGIPASNAIKKVRSVGDIHGKADVKPQGGSRPVKAPAEHASIPASLPGEGGLDTPADATAGHIGPSRQASGDMPQPPGGGTASGASAVEVVAHPLYQINPPPPYPRLSRRLGQEGVVLLEVEVSAAGLADDLRLLASSGHEALDAAALDAVRSWRFSAGLRNGQPVAMRVRVPVRFSLHDGN